MSRLIPSLDPWTYPIAVHWSRGITKLDFVHDHYMVRGKIQGRADVLGDTHGTIRDAEEQRSWVTLGQGLDLRTFDSGGDISANARRAYLRNKTAEPDRDNPGALNEFLRLGYTVVIEFDWVDIPAALAASNPGAYGNGVDAVYDIMTSADRLNTELLVLSSVERLIEYTSDTTTIWHGYWHYVDNGFPQGSEEVRYTAVWVDEIADPSGEYSGRGDPAYGYAPFWAPWRPADESWSNTGSVTEQDYVMVPQVSAYEWDQATTRINGRIIGAMPDVYNDSTVPMQVADAGVRLAAPFGRVRMAVTATKNRLAASVNGGDPIQLQRPPLFTMPRPYPTDESGIQLTYFPIGNDPNFPTLQKTYEVFFHLPGFVRCVWLYREPRLPSQLKKLSVIRPLVEPDHPAWKTT